MDELIGDMLRAGYVPAGYDELRRMLRAAANGEDRKVPNRKDRRAFERAVRKARTKQALRTRVTG